MLAIEVHTSIGRVAADVSAESHGTTSWLPGTASPSTRLVIPGVPPSGSTAGLFVADPGASTAKVTVTAITPQGQIRPFGSQSVDLPGQSASYVALSPLGGTTAALQITSNVPVVAAVLVPGSGPGVLTSATAPISEQAIVAGNTSGGGMAASVVLSAPGAAARVRLTEIAPASRGSTSVTASQVVPVKAGRTLAAPVKAPKGAKHDSAFALVITPLAGSGPVYAARVETQDRSTVVSIIPAASALTTISLPPVRDSYDAISPRSEPRQPSSAVAGVDDLGVHPEDLGELLDHHVEDQLAQLVLVFGPGQQRPPVQHDARSGGRVPRVADIRRAADDAGQRHPFVLADGVGVGNLLDRELHAGEFGLPARLEPGHRLEHHVVELLGPAPVERDAGRHQAAAQPAPAPVAPPRPDRGTWPRAASEACLHRPVCTVTERIRSRPPTACRA